MILTATPPSPNPNQVHASERHLPLLLGGTVAALQSLPEQIWDFIRWTTRLFSEEEEEEEEEERLINSERSERRYGSKQQINLIQTDGDQPRV